MSDAVVPEESVLRGLAEPSFDSNAMRVLKERYFAKKTDGSLESPKEFLWRVASAIAEPERPYAAENGRDADGVVDGVAHAFYEMMARRDFMPNTPCLVNAGRPLSMLSACFVLPVPDSIEGIFYSIKAMALVQKSGGGTGFAFSDLRQQGAEVESTGRDASGPVSFMKVFNAATDSIKQGGVRRGANMGVLRVDHPDIFSFMRCKKELDAENRALWNRLSDTGRYTEQELAHIKQELLQTQINNFNISVGVTDAFMAAVEADGDFDLHDPRTHEVVKTVRAREIWDAIVEGAWQNGEPGVLFLDHPEWNPLPGLGPIQATNPCVTGDTWVHTYDGPRRVKDLVGKPFGAIVDGEPYASTEQGFFFSGVKPVFELTTNDGFALKATGDHKIATVTDSGERVWKTLGELQPGDPIVIHQHRRFVWDGPGCFEDGVLLGSLVGDGHFHARAGGKTPNVVMSYWGESARHMAARAANSTRMRVRTRADFSQGHEIVSRGEIRVSAAALTDLAARFGITPEFKHVSPQVESASHDFYRGFLQGWFDADGTVGGDERSGYYVRLTSGSLDDLRAAQRMLVRLGVQARIHVNRRRAPERSLPDGKGGTKRYQCAAYHELSIPWRALGRFRDAVGFAEPAKREKLDTIVAMRNEPVEKRPWAVVRSIEPAGLAPVYDCTIPGPHAFDANAVYVRNCGEQSLHGWDSCNLGSINVGHFYDGRAKDVDWERLAQTTALSIRFLDNVIDANVYPLDEIAQMVRGNRRVGLGIMGFADLLIQMEIAYGTPEAIAFAAKLMKFIQTRAIETSEQLARERGDFPNKHLSVWKDDPRPRRNAALLSIAPTGTISMIAGCSFGCEPYFGMAYTKHVMKDAEGRPQHLYYVVPLFEEIAKDERFFSDELLARVEENRGSLKGLTGVPQHWQDVFTVAADVSVDQHIDMLAAFQKYTCNAVSKCVAAGTLIPTDKGLIPIEEMGSAPEGEFGNLNGAYRVIGHDGEWHAVTGFYRNGRVPTVRISASNGATLEASETHHVLTLEGWKAMRDLRTDDLIVGRFEELSAEGGAPLDVEPYDARPWARRIVLPNRMSPDVARWLGMLAAAGHADIATGNVGISGNDRSDDVAREFDALCERLFELAPHVTVDKRTGERRRSLTSRALARFAIDLIGSSARTKRVPEAVLRGSFAEKVAFLGGITLDGHPTRDTLVVYAGTSKALADGVEAIARSLGLPSCYRWAERRAGNDDVHQVRAFGDLQRAIRAVESPTPSQSPAGHRERMVRTPDQVYAMTLPHGHAASAHLRGLKEQRPAACFAQTLETLGVPLADSREYLVRVQAIAYGEADTYDIEVEGAHSYVVNGLVSHNTINAPNDDTRENVSRAIFRAYRAGCKGFTYYRDGSRTEQVVTFSKDGDIKGANRDVGADAAAAGGTPATAVPPELVMTSTAPPAAAAGSTDMDIEALLAKANALLEVR